MFDRGSPIPIYVQVKRHILSLIRRIPPADIKRVAFTETDLAKELKVNRLTVRQAVTELVNEGLLYRVRGVGIFVSPPKVEGQLKNIERFLDEWQSQTRSPKSEVFFFGWVNVPEPYAESLHLLPDAQALCFRRRRFIENTPLAIDVRYIPQYFASFVEKDNVLEQPAIDSIVEHTGLALAKVDMKVEAVAATADNAHWLDIPLGSPLLRRTVTMYLSTGEPALTGWSVYRGDLYQYHVVIPDPDP